MTGLVVITRPEPDALDYAEELRGQGFDVFVEPMLRIEPVAFKVPDWNDFDALLATSANVFKFLDPSFRGQDSHLVIYCVGKYTAEAARCVGFQNVVSVDGTGADLLGHVLALADAKDLRFLHIGGDHVAFPLVEKLKEANIQAQSLVVYKSVQVKAFSSGFLDHLRTGNIQAVTLFSKRTAEAFVGCVREAESQSMFADIKALLISDGVLECVRVLPWAGVYVSKAPDRQGMRVLLEGL